MELALLNVPDFSEFQIIKQGTVSLSRAVGVASDSETVDHNLDYVPMVIAFQDLFGTFFILPAIDVDPNVGANQGLARTITNYTVNSTSITFTLAAYGTYKTGSSDAVTVKYYLLRETAK